jgi:hypothetical protein
MLLQILRNVNNNAALQRKGMEKNCQFLANSRGEMLLKAVEQPLGTAKRVLESRREMPKGYWAASGKFLKGIGKPLGNV